MTTEAVTARLRALSAAGRGGVQARVPLDRASVTRRLRSLGELADLCRRLGAAKKGATASH